MKHANTQTDKTIPQCVHFVHFMQKTHEIVEKNSDVTKNRDRDKTKYFAHM
jgi:hypothetical protein